MQYICEDRNETIFNGVGDWNGIDGVEDTRQRVSGGDGGYGARASGEKGGVESREIRASLVEYVRERHRRMKVEIGEEDGRCCCCWGARDEGGLRGKAGRMGRWLQEGRGRHSGWER